MGRGVSMAPKAVSKSGLKAKGQAKGQAKAKAKAQCQTDGQAKGKAKAQAKGQAQDLQPRAPKGSARGWDDIQPDSKSMGKLGAMAVMGQLKSLAKRGNTAPLDHYRNLKGQEKIDFAVQLKVDREAAFMKVVESHSLETSVNNQWVKGWITEAQVAKEEGLFNYSTCQEQKILLQMILDDIPCKPHDKPQLAAAGIKLYDYSAKQLSLFTESQKDKVTTEATENKDADDHDNIVSMMQDMDNPMGSQVQPTWSNAHLQLVQRSAQCGVLVLISKQQCLVCRPRTTSPSTPPRRLHQR